MLKFLANLFARQKITKNLKSSMETIKEVGSSEKICFAATGYYLADKERAIRLHSASLLDEERILRRETIASAAIDWMMSLRRKLHDNPSAEINNVKLEIAEEAFMLSWYLTPKPDQQSVESWAAECETKGKQALENWRNADPFSMPSIIKDEP